MTYLTVVPAYGRDYASRKEVLADWNAGKDFRICDVSAGRDDGRYLSNRDVPAGTTLMVRYGQLRKVTAIKVPA
jgi:hypothetical protein